MKQDTRGAAEGPSRKEKAEAAVCAVLAMAALFGFSFLPEVMGL